MMTTNIEYIKQQLAYAKEQLMLADDMSSKVTWGNRCDVLEAALLDMEVATHLVSLFMDSATNVHN